MSVSIYVPELRTAPAGERPCEVRIYHRPEPVITQGHHIHPVFLQNRLWGKIRDNTFLWVCGTDHDSIHAWLYYLLGEHHKPAVDPGPLVRARAQASFDWYLANGGQVSE